jgi:hypothetical protein
MTVDNAGVGTSAQGNHSGQWGLASILLSSLVMILFPLILFLVFVCVIGMNWDDAHSSHDVDLGVTAAHVLIPGLLGVAVFALVCGVFGLASALFRRQSFGLSLAGTVTSVVAVVAAGFLLIATLHCIEWARNYQKTHYDADGKKIPPTVPRQIPLPQ